jgi:DegV family protein with EDD domain
VELRASYAAALADSGGAGVVGVHLSSQLSGTCTAAEQAAAELGDAVAVVDSRSTAMGTGFVALAAARAAAAGADRDAVVAEARATVGRTHGFIVVHRLDNLRRSGRIGGAAAWLGTALSLKPLLRIDDGKLVLAQRVRTPSKAVATMIDRVGEIVGDRRAELAVHHVANADGAAEVAATLAERLPTCPPALISDLGPVLALHVGAGALAVVAYLTA